MNDISGDDKANMVRLFRMMKKEFEFMDELIDFIATTDGDKSIMESQIRLRKIKFYEALIEQYKYVDRS